MSPPARKQPGPDLPDLMRGRRRRARRRQQGSRRRRLTLLGVLLGVVFATVLLTVGFGGAIAYKAGCSLSSLRPINIGENSFIYAADGSRLGAIPSERNR